MILYILNSITFDLSRIDGNAWTIFLIGFGIVYAALIFIYLFFNNLPKFLNIKFKKEPKSESSATTSEAKSSKTETSNSIDKEVNAAIAMALSLYLDDQHDDEPLVLTINIQDRLNSQWSSKIQNIN
jgi:Na+-transporting methylmalonyl-CoA/oxaloacetate decarboxylase gamma subunit